MPSELRLALVQMDCTESEDDNLQTALQWLDNAYQKDADVVVLPELFNTGYFLAGMRQKARSNVARTVLAQAASDFGLHVLAGMPELSGETVFNSAWFFSPLKKGRVVYRKVNLFPGKPISEKTCFTPGNPAKPVQTPFGPLGIQICMDLRYPNGSRALAQQGANALVYLSAFPKIRIHQWLPLLKARAIENQCYVAGCNRVGTDSIEMGGYSVVFDPNGELVSGLDGKKHGLVTADLDFKKVDRARAALKLW